MVELRELSLEDGEDVYEMVKEIGEGGHGFGNSLYSESIAEFKEKLLKNFQTARGVNLKPGMVPQTIYWLYVDGKPVGYVKLRHDLNEKLRELGGHIGYVICPSERRKGYATIQLREVLKKAKEIGIERALITCDEDHIASRKVIEKNQGVLEKIKNGCCCYWIDLHN